MKNIILSLSILAGLLMPLSSMPVKESINQGVEIEQEDEGYESDDSFDAGNDLSIKDQQDLIDGFLDDIRKNPANASAMQSNIQAMVTLELLDRLNSMKKNDKSEKNNNLNFTQSIFGPLKDSMRGFIHYGVSLPLCGFVLYCLVYEFAWKRVGMPQMVFSVVKDAGVQVISDVANAAGTQIIEIPAAIGTAMYDKAAEVVGPHPIIRLLDIPLGCKGWIPYAAYKVGLIK